MRVFLSRLACVPVLLLSVRAHARDVEPRGGPPPARPPFVLVRVGEMLKARAGGTPYVLPWEGASPSPPPVEPPVKKKRGRDAFEELDEATRELDAAGGAGGGEADPGGQKAAFQAWRAEYEKEFNAWKKEHEAFLLRADEYKQTLTDVKLDAAAPPARTLKRRADGAVVRVVSSAVEHPVRDQGRRGTCASFAALHAVEVLLAQNGIREDLSEQYFYWLSKPECQHQRCSTAQTGSAYVRGLSASRDAARLDIPSEQACPYVAEPMPENDTQTPLPGRCNAGGRAQVAGFDTIEGTESLLAALDEHRPVIVGTRLSENFFRSEGLVTLEDARRAEAAKGMHAGGHAYVLVGYVALPANMHATEGRHCFLAANSWGSWGLKGHACVTEKWLETYRHDARAIVLSRVRVAD